ncbi:hypothetical protein ACVW1C_005442 [Bradyrhizobium sp. USDA 4011]
MAHHHQGLSRRAGLPGGIITSIFRNIRNVTLICPTCQVGWSTAGRHRLLGMGLFSIFSAARPCDGPGAPMRRKAAPGTCQFRHLRCALLRRLEGSTATSRVARASRLAQRRNCAVRLAPLDDGMRSRGMRRVGCASLANPPCVIRYAARTFCRNSSTALRSMPDWVSSSRAFDSTSLAALPVAAAAVVTPPIWAEISLEPAATC